MFKVLVFSSYCLLLLHPIQGLICLKCTNAGSHEECDSTGNVEMCSGNDLCRTEIRSISITGIQLITKGCKQAQACRNDNVQRSCAAGPPPPNSVCVCCCPSDRCNIGIEGCPRNPRRRNSISGRSDIANTCNPTIVSLKHGTVQCSNQNKVGSRCRFTCQKRYFVNGESSRLTCQKSGIWSSIPPTCSAIQCRPFYSFLRNGRVQCTKGNNLRSVCKFKCHVGYALKGNTASFCSWNRESPTRGKWTHTRPQCIKQAPFHCANLKVPANGKIQCSNGHAGGSVCKFNCTKGYALDGSQAITCLRAAGGSMKWSTLAPSCEIISQCPTIRPDPSLMVECSNGGNIGSICVFLCYPTLQLIGKSHVTCMKRNYEAMWEPELPHCIAKTCSYLGDLPNGIMYCDRGNALNSRCTFSCLENYNMIGREEITCTSSGADEVIWNDAMPKCQVMCPMLSSLENGHVECLEGNYIGASCSFGCADDFKLNGAYKTTCVESKKGALWDNAMPVCEKICGEISKMPNGKVTCSNSNLLNSTCLFTCMDGHKLIGAAKSSCVDIDQRGTNWDEGIPKCTEYCPELPMIENGITECTDSNLLQTTCSFSCDLGFALQGSYHTSCERNKEDEVAWTQPVPACEILQCPDLVPISHGEWKCSEAFDYKSVCKFSCEPHYRLLPSISKSITCRADQTWDKTAPCCSTPCTKNPPMDLLFALDSSSSLGHESWNMMIKFVQMVARMYEAKEDGTCIGAFRYNNVIDVNNTIPFNYAKLYGKEALLYRIAEIPYDGKGTKTGRALSYAASEMFHPKNGDRPEAQNVLIVVTDGRSQDKVKKETDELLDRGVLMFAVGVQSEKGGLDDDQLNYISGGNEHHVFILDDGFSALTQEFARDLTQVVCQDPCLEP